MNQPDYYLISCLLDQIRLMNPNLRFGQIIGNALNLAGLDPDPYYVEDSKMIDILKAYVVWIRKQMERTAQLQDNMARYTAKGV